jgi:hypothetical protein
MKNFIKEFIKQRKIKKAQMTTSNYGDFKVECIYHDNFIKLMNTVTLMKINERLDSIPEVYTLDTEWRTTVKGENLSLNSRSILSKNLYYIKYMKQIII